MSKAVVWVSGASSGLGLSACQALAAAGHQVVAGARSFKDREGRQAGSSIFGLALDVRDGHSVATFVAKALERFGPPGILICAAGILTFGPAEELSQDELSAVMDTNFYGTVRLVQAALPHLRKTGGKLALISSVNGLMPTPYQSAYVAAKHALEGWAECLMLETRGQGIQVMLVEPGDHSGGSSAYRSTACQLSPLYQESLERSRKVILGDEAKGPSAQAFGKGLAQVLGRKRLPARYQATQVHERLAIILHDILPGRLFQRFLCAYYKV